MVKEKSVVYKLIESEGDELIVPDGQNLQKTPEETYGRNSWANNPKSLDFKLH